MATSRSKKPTFRTVRQWAIEWLGQHGAGSLNDLAKAYVRWLDQASPPNENTARLAWEYLEKHHSTERPAFYAWEYLLEAAQPHERAAAGVYFTPAVISRWLADAAIGRLRGTESTVTIVDPACGTGAILVEAIHRVERGCSWRVRGLEKTSATAMVAQRLLAEATYSHPSLSLKIVCGDALSREHLGLLGPEESAAQEALIILGNPPYSTGKRREQEGLSTEKLWMDELLADYRTGLRERKSALADDYVRFLRWSQYQIGKAGSGVMAMITSRTFLEGITHRRMRESLRQAFDELYVVDLAGDMSRNRDSTVDADENIFPIRSGVALTVFVRGLVNSNRQDGQPGTVFYSRLTGSRRDKLAALASTPFEAVQWHALPVTGGDAWRRSASVPPRSGERGYDAWPSLGEAFHVRVSGIQSKNDALWTADTKEMLLEQISSQTEFEPNPELIREYAAAPFVKRFLYYDPQRIGRARFAGMQHMLRDNIAMVFARQSTNDGVYDQVMATRDLVVDRFFYSRRGTPYLAPLALYEGDERKSNFRPKFLHRFVGAEIANATPSHEMIFAALLALLSSRVYRERFADALRVDFPRVPSGVGVACIERLARLGRQLADLHCRPIAPCGTDSTTFTVEDLARAKNWTLGGYRVLKRWGRDRARMPVADNEPWRPILQRWRAIEQLLDRIDPIVCEML